MAKQADKTTAESESIQGYFRPILMEDPKKYLSKQNRDNKELYDRWLQDHPEQKEVPASVKNSLNNLKSQLRKKLKLRKLKKEGGRGTPKASAAVETAVASPARGPRRANTLEVLESQIDGCMDFAKSLDREGLEDVIEILRQARNQVIARAGAR